MGSLPPLTWGQTLPMIPEGPLDPACERHRGVGMVPESQVRTSPPSVPLLWSLGQVTSLWASAFSSAGFRETETAVVGQVSQSTSTLTLLPIWPTPKPDRMEGTLWHSCLPLWTLSTPQPVSSFLQPRSWGPERRWDLLQVIRPVTWDGVRTDPRLGNNSYVKPQTVFPQRLVAPQEQNYTCKAESTRTGWPRLIQFTARDSTTLVPARSLLAYDC